MEKPDIVYSWFYEALKEAIKKNGRGFQSALAAHTGKTEGGISNITSGSKRAAFDTQVKIAEAAGYEYLEFLKRGRQLMEGGSTMERPPPQEQPLVVETLNGFDKLVLEKHKEHFRGVPLYESGRLSAFAGGEAFNEKEAPDSTVIVYRPELRGRVSHDLRALRVGADIENLTRDKGDSMEPTIPRGSIVIVDLDDKDFVDKKIFVLRDPRDPDQNNPLTLIKRARKINQENFKGFALISDNRDYLPIMTDLEWHELVMGRVVWMWRSLEEA